MRKSEGKYIRTEGQIVAPAQVGRTRKVWLDNIRWATVLLVVIYHVFYLFNACGVSGGVGAFSDVQYQDTLLPLVYPWFMVLLFAIAGMSARYALERKTTGEFIRNRTVKLLVPSTLGLLVFQWVTGLMNIRIGGGLAYMTDVPAPILYLIFAMSGIGPLWFAQMLWLFSLILVLIRKLDPSDRILTFCGKMSPVILIPLCFVLWGGTQIGNVPVLTVYRFGVYGTAFLIGYFFLSHDAMQEQLARFHLPLLALSLLTAAVYVAHWFGQDYTSGGCLKSLFTNFYAWITTLTVLGCGKAWLDKISPFAAYMSKISYGIYVLHYPFVLLTCQILKNHTALPAAVTYPLSAAFALIASLGCYELFRRIPVIRFTVLGIRKPNSENDTTERRALQRR